MTAISLSLQGLQAAAAKFETASARLLQATSGAARAGNVSAGGANDNDPAQAIVDQIEAKLQFKASALTLRAADEMTRSLLDIKI